MATTARSVIDRFFHRRDEQEGEVISLEQAVALLNEAQEELIGLKLIIKQAQQTWPANEAELDVPADFSMYATDRAYFNGEDALWTLPRGEGDSFLAYLDGKLQRYPAPPQDSEIKYLYFAVPQDIDANEDLADQNVMNGLEAPGLSRFLLYRMLESAAIMDEEASMSEAYNNKCMTVKGELQMWRHTTFADEQATWKREPIIEEHQIYEELY